MIRRILLTVALAASFGAGVAFDRMLSPPAAPPEAAASTAGEFRVLAVGGPGRDAVPSEGAR
jgi:hypothetical protein